MIAPPESLLSSPVTPTEILSWLDANGIAHDTRAHQAVFTVEESRHVSAGIPGAHTKNLFLKDKKGRLFLVVAEHERRIDLKRLHDVIGASGRLSFGNAEQLMAALGVTPGSVTALSVINDRITHAVTVVLDDGLMQADRINCHPLINTMTTGLSRAGLMAVFRATGHEPLIVTLPAPAPDGETG